MTHFSIEMISKTAFDMRENRVIVHGFSMPYGKIWTSGILLESRVDQNYDVNTGCRIVNLSLADPLHEQQDLYDPEIFVRVKSTDARMHAKMADNGCESNIGIVPLWSLYEIPQSCLLDVVPYEEVLYALLQNPDYTRTRAGERTYSRSDDIEKILASLESLRANYAPNNL